MNENNRTTLCAAAAKLPFEARRDPVPPGTRVIEEADEAPQKEKRGVLNGKALVAGFLILLSWAGLIYAIYVILAKSRG